MENISDSAWYYVMRGVWRIRVISTINLINWLEWQYLPAAFEDALADLHRFRDKPSESVPSRSFR